MLPVVLHHGVLGFGSIQLLGKIRITNFRLITTAIAQRGHPLIIENVHPTASVDRRARKLKQTILDSLQRLRLADQRVIVIAHSMGGLDCRHMITQLGMAKHVAALVTVCTPHRGSPYADWCMKHLGQQMGALRLARLLKLDINGIEDLTTGACTEFNERTADAAGVRYYSVSAARPRHRVPPFFYHSHKIIAAAEGENDGMVSVRSAQWGEHLGTWPVDHLHAINRRMVFELKEPTGDVTPRYLEVLDHVNANVR